ncbi:MAG: 3-deoxy-D-manno-octulosonic acid transferase [Prosthecochloris sp.]|nr:3-deoxy-D-manno-octulosonic acid transferase [Prosthecochloris sp.]
MAPQLFLYNAIVPLLAGSLKLFSPAFPRLRTFFDVRKNMFTELEQSVAEKKDSEFRVWIHAASAGEFEQSRPIIAALKKSRPDLSVFVSFQSDSGYSVYRNYPDAAAVWYHPVDTRQNAKKTVALIRPDVVVIMRYDFWPNHLLAAKKSGARLFLVAAVLQDRSIYGKPLVRQFYRQVFSLFDYIYTVSEKDRERFSTLFGRNDALKAGDPRFDQVVQRSANTSKIDTLAACYAGKIVLVAGSTWERDEEILLPASMELAGKLSLILVPHDVSPGNISRLETLLHASGISFSRLSSLPENFSSNSVLVVDTVGLLAELYTLAGIAYVGGGFGVNVHNTLEPAVYGIPVLFGPNHHNSPEAEELVRITAATVIPDRDTLADTLRKLLDDPDTRALQGSLAGSFVQERLGASQTVAKKILNSITI